LEYNLRNAPTPCSVPPPRLLFISFVKSIFRDTVLRDTNHSLQPAPQSSIIFKMQSKLLLASLFTSAVLASPAPHVEVIQVRQLEKRQIDLPTDIIPSGALNSVLSQIESAGPSLLSEIGTAVPSGLLSSLASRVTALPSDISKCTPPANLISIALNIPSPPAALESALEQYSTVTDVCNLPSFTGSVGSQFTSYTSEFGSYFSKYQSEIASYTAFAATACPDIFSLVSGQGLPTGTDLFPSCTSGSSGAIKSGATKSGASGSAASSSPTGTGAAAQSSGGAAHMEPGFMAAAGLVAGVMGVVAAL
jgi:hypothetical protein